MWGWALAWLGVRKLRRVGREVDRAEREQRGAVHAARCAVAAMLKDQPEAIWKNHGLDRARTLRECGLEATDQTSPRAVEFYSSIGQKR